MRCTGCFKEFKVGEKAYATVSGCIAGDPMLDGDEGFYMNDIEPWLSVLCEKCGMALHNDFIAGKLQARDLKESRPQRQKQK